MKHHKYEYSDSDINGYVEFAEAVHSGILTDLTKKIKELELFDTRAAESFSYADQLIISIDNQYVWCQYMNGMIFIIDITKSSKTYIDRDGITELEQTEFHNKLYSDIFWLLPIRN